MINKMVKELNILMLHLIKGIGMKAIGLMERWKEGEFVTSQTAINIKANLRIIKELEKVTFISATVISMKALGLMTSIMEKECSN